MIAVKAAGLTKKFDRTAAINGIGFAIEKGEIIGLIGPDGAGKTTLLRLLTGLLKPDTGSIIINGINVVQSPQKAKDDIGYMSQHFSLYGDLSVSENMRFFSGLYGVSKPEFLKKRKELLRFSGLSPFEGRPARNLSGGMQKKLALACCLFHTPRVLLLDEPTTGVDPVSRKELWDILFRLNRQGATLILTTPYMDEARRCHRVGLIHEGRILSFQPPQRLVREMADEVIEVLLEKSADRDTLKSMPDVKNIYPFGEAFHLSFDPGKGAEEKTRAFLKAQGLEYKKIKKITPSFEDAFISLIKGQTGQSS